MLTGDRVRQIKTRTGFLVKFAAIGIEYDNLIVINPHNSLPRYAWEEIIKEQKEKGFKTLIVGDKNSIHCDLNADYDLTGLLSSEEIYAIIHKSVRFYGVLGDLVETAKYFNNEIYEII